MDMSGQVTWLCGPPHFPAGVFRPNVQAGRWHSRGACLGRPRPGDRDTAVAAAPAAPSSRQAKAGTVTMANELMLVLSLEN